MDHNSTFFFKGLCFETSRDYGKHTWPGTQHIFPLFSKGTDFLYFNVASVNGNRHTGAVGGSSDTIPIVIGDVVNLLPEPVTVEVAVGAGDSAGVGVALLPPGRVGVAVSKLKVALLLL